MNTKRGLCAVSTLLLGAALCAADWDPSDGHKMHFPQLPDIDLGMNIASSFSQLPDGLIVEKWLGDDWKCTQTGLVDRIHFWGSWLDDRLFDPQFQGTFQIGIYKDIPAGVDDIPWSRPGDLLWEWFAFPGQYIAREWAFSQEPFFDPNFNEIIGFDTIVWQYNVCIPRDVAFKQHEGEIYWPVIHNVDPTNDGVMDERDFPFRWGWKSSFDHFNDAAVFVDNGPAFPGFMPPPPFGAPWRPMFYPPGHPFAGEQIDLSFVIDECRADFNGDCLVNGIDVGLFLQAYATGQASADMNCDGQINGIDVGLFLQAYAGGC